MKVLLLHPYGVIISYSAGENSYPLFMLCFLHVSNIYLNCDTEKDISAISSHTAMGNLIASGRYTRALSLRKLRDIVNKYVEQD